MVADALSRKEQVKPIRVCALKMQIQSNLMIQIREAQEEALRNDNLANESLNGLEKSLELSTDGIKKFNGRVWIPHFGHLRELVF